MRLAFLLFLVVFGACNQAAIPENETSVPENDYYFSMKAFLSPRTYCYVNRNDTTEKSYWQMQSSVSGNDTFFHTRVYDEKLGIIDEMNERVINGNARVTSWILYDYDSAGNKHASACHIVSPEIFKRDQKVGESIQEKVTFKHPLSSEMCEMTRTRTLKSSTSTQKSFNDVTKVRTIGSREGYEYSVQSVYEKGIGLVSYKLETPYGEIKDFVLSSQEAGERFKN